MAPPIAITPPELDSAPTLPVGPKLTTSFDDTLRFYLNGTRVVLDDIDPEITLLEYLRGIGLTGTKLFVSMIITLSLRILINS
jgi:xanthine dehydrogenase/oxidase